MWLTGCGTGSPQWLPPGGKAKNGIVVVHETGYLSHPSLSAGVAADFQRAAGLQSVLESHRIGSNTRGCGVRTQLSGVAVGL